MLQDILRLLMGNQAPPPGMMPQDQPPQTAPGGATPFNNQNVPPPAPVGAPVEPDIVVGNTGIDPAKVRSGLLGGTFGVGRTGGNILGMLGDAFLTQAGRDPQYAPRLQQAREAEALQNFQSDPTGALDKFLMVNPEKATSLINTNADNQRADKATTAVLRDKDLEYENTIRGRAGSMLYAANEKTFPQLRAQAEAYLKSKGINDVQLPSTWEEAQTWARGDVPVKDQLTADATADYRAATLDQRRRDSDARAAYYRSNVAERRAYHDKSTANADPNNKPPTPTTVLGKVQDKVARMGLPSLSPGERKIYDDSFKGKENGKGAGNGIKYSVDPTTGKVTIGK